eukprot:8980577-Lingulodinium_polyedra.AAC.1
MEVQAAADHFGIQEDAEQLDSTLYDGIHDIVHDKMVYRVRRYAGRGCELWRALFNEAKGYSPEVTRAKAERVQRPARSASIGALLEDLEEWEYLYNEVVSG